MGPVAATSSDAATAISTAALTGRRCQQVKVPDWPDWYAEYLMRTLGEDDDRPGESEAHQRRARSRD
jgi:hypothetical protein